jgi:hypothetical protein
VLARRKPQNSLPVHLPPPPRGPSASRGSVQESPPVERVKAKPVTYAELHPVKKVAPYIPAQRARLNTSDTFNTKSSLTSNTLNSRVPRQPSKSPQKSSMREAGPVSSTPPQKKQRSSSDVSSGMHSDTNTPEQLPLTKESLVAVGVESAEKGVPMPPPPNLSIFKGAGVVSFFLSFFLHLL